MELIIFQVGETKSLNNELNLILEKAWNKNIDAKAIKIERDISEEHLKFLVTSESKKADGVLIQLPLPKHIDLKKIYGAIPMKKNIVNFVEKKTIDNVIETFINKYNRVC